MKEYAYPNAPGVYLMKDVKGNILYIGKAKVLKKRIAQYFLPGRDGRPHIPYLMKQVAQIDCIITPSEKEAILLEHTLIQKHKPRYNFLLKDDKSFICLQVNTQHPWPRLQLIRAKETTQRDHWVFGPYPNAFMAREVFELMRSLFPLRQCSDQELISRRRPCILYAMKRCVAPCVGKCSKEEYHTLLHQMARLLKGQDTSLLQELKKERLQAAKALEFERAGALHAKIQKLEYLHAHRAPLVHSRQQDADIFGWVHSEDHVFIVKLLLREGRIVGSTSYFLDARFSDIKTVFERFLMQHYMEMHERPQEVLLPHTLPTQGLLEELLKIELLCPKQGGKKRLIQMAHQNAQALLRQKLPMQGGRDTLLIELEEKLGLTRYPMHIEGFDTSSSQGRDFVAAHVTFIDGLYEKSKKRLYRIHASHIHGDVQALEETLSRRFERAKAEGIFPDLLLIDGGKTQLNIALEVLKRLEIAATDCVSIAKEKALHTKGLTQERIFTPAHKAPIVLERSDPVLLFLQEIRDEAHRAAIHYFRLRQSKRGVHSPLDDIPGIGPIKRKRLLQYFGSLSAIKKATPEELKQVPGITTKDIENLYTQGNSKVGF